MSTDDGPHQVPPEKPRYVGGTGRTIRYLTYSCVALAVTYLALYPLAAATLGYFEGTNGIGSSITVFGVVGLITFAVLRVVVIPVLLMLDLYHRRDISWPGRWASYVYATVGTILPLPGGAYYLYRRYVVTGSPSWRVLRVFRRSDAPVDSNWWVVAPVASTVLPLVVANANYDLAADTATQAAVLNTASGWPMFVLFLVSLAAWFLYPVAAYYDTMAVVRADIDWSPDPRVYVLGAVFLPFVVGPYHFYRRLPTIPGVSDTSPLGVEINS